jgi:glycosyltransferase involved in cell wall biosynthesis
MPAARPPLDAEVSLVCYPFHPTKETGRGVDRYLFELIENLRASSPDIKLRVIEQGSSEGTLASGTKLGRLLWELRSLRSGAYHAASPAAGAAALLLGKRPVVVTIHDMVPFHVSGYSAAFKLAYVRYCTKICLEKAAAIIVPFRVTQDELVSQHGTDAAKVHLVNYGVDHAVYDPRPEIPRKPQRILYIGEVSRAKGVDVLIRAFSIVKKAVPEAELLIGGKPNKDQRLLEAQSRSLAVRDLEFLGFVPEGDLASLYATATVMVFPSRYGFGLSTLEAMACGTPVVVAETLDAPEFVADAGLLVKPGDAADLASSLLRVLQEAELRERLSSKGIARAALYSWASMAKKVADVYHAVLA